MEITLAAIALLPGLAFGSFLNVLAARIPLRRSVVSPGSACMACATPLAWYDNVPLLSFALLRGKCRHCDAPIPWRYPLVEATTALLIAACVLLAGVSLFVVLNWFSAAFPEASLDLRVSRQFRLAERVSMQALVEGFNILNRANWQIPNNVYGAGTAPAPGFGAATAAADPRQIPCAA